MESKEFKQIVECQLEYCLNLLGLKSEEYNISDNDRLHAFKTSAKLQGVTSKKALSGMMSKHTISIYDMLNSDKEFPIEKWEEKITDNINYLLLLKAMIIEEKLKVTNEEV